MGSRYYNPSDFFYKEYTNNNEYYVDKTDLIIELNKRINSYMKYICVSLPKYFGKTITVNMLVAYYSYSKSRTNVFDNKKISKFKDWDKYLGKFNVIYLNMKSIFIAKNIKRGINQIKKLIIAEVKENEQNFECDEKEDIREITENIYESTNRKIVIIIDNWDFVLRDKKHKTKSFMKYLKFINLLIEDNPHIALTYMTGFFSIKNYNVSLGFEGIFDEFTMISPDWMAKYIGFIDDEVKELCHRHLDDKIENSTQNISNKRQKLNNGLYNKQNKEKEEYIIFYEKIKDFYYGYQLTDKFSEKYKVYSPYSIVEAIKRKKIDNYQMAEKDIKDILYKIIKKNYDNLKYIKLLLIENKRIDIESSKFQNDEISFVEIKNNLIMLVYLGYLGYDNSTNEIYIPNKELHEIFREFIKPSKGLIKRQEIYNPGENDYKEFIKNKYFIDKTNIILQINDIIDSSNIKNICVTGPRGFGKTVTVDMLMAYYSFSESKITAFNNKNIINNENWDKYLGKYNVIKLNMIKYFLSKNVKDGIRAIKKSIIDEVKENEQIFKCDEEEEDIGKIIKEIYKSTHREIVLIIDEWDVALRNKNFDSKSSEKYLNFLTELIKDNEYIALTYMTGILPIRSYLIDSFIGDVFNEFTITSDCYFSEYIGFTDSEIKELCKNHLSDKILKNSYKNQIPLSLHENKYKDKDTIIEINYEMIKNWCNGYRLKNRNDDKEYDIYSPFSVIEAIENKQIANY